MSELVGLTDMSCSSYFENSTYTFTWTIHDFNTIINEESIESAKFYAGNFGWMLQIFPRGNDDKDKGYVSIFLVLKSCKQSKDNVFVNVKQFSVSIINNDRVKQNVRHVEGKCFRCIEDDWGWERFIKRDFFLRHKKSLLPDGNLTIFLEMVLEGSTLSTKSNKIAQPEIKRLRRLAEDQNEMFINATFSDVVIVVEGREIKAHKSILASRSSVFLAMLDSDMLEASRSSVEITDLNYDTVMEFLRFLYTGRSERIAEMAPKLLFAADKYAVNDLKKLCEDALQQQLRVENACDTLILADLHSCDRLETETLEFICLKMTEVMKSDGFARLTQAHLLKKILEASSLKKCQCEEKTIEEYVIKC